MQVGVLTGTEGDATPFTDVTVANVSSTLHKIGFQKHGNEVMYSGHTGRMLNTKVGGDAFRTVLSKKIQYGVVEVDAVGKGLSRPLVLYHCDVSYSHMCL